MPEDRRFLRAWPKWLGYAALLGVMALGFVGYLHPNMLLDWEAILQMCGMR